MITQSDYITVTMSFDGNTYRNLDIPSVHYADFVEAWMNGHRYINKVYSVRHNTHIVTRTELIDLSEVTHVIISS